MQDLSRQSVPLFVTSENKDAVIIRAGQPVANHPSGSGIIRASGTDNSKNAIGQALEDISPGFSGKIITAGALQLPDWTNVIGSVTLAALGVYYLDTFPGHLSTLAPITTGNAVQLVGRTIAPDTIKVALEISIVI